MLDPLFPRCLANWCGSGWSDLLIDVFEGKFLNVRDFWLECAPYLLAMVAIVIEIGKEVIWVHLDLRLPGLPRCSQAILIIEVFCRKVLGWDLLWRPKGSWWYCWDRQRSPRVVINVFDIDISFTLALELLQVFIDPISEMLLHLVHAFLELEILRFILHFLFSCKFVIKIMFKNRLFKLKN